MTDHEIGTREEWLCRANEILKAASAYVGDRCQVAV
jgi:hypothetical protein